LVLLLLISIRYANSSNANPISYITNKNINKNHSKSTSSINQLVSTDTQTHENHHTISMFSVVVNIIADLCPHGMLPLAYGFAQGGPSGVIPSVLLVLLFGLMSGYTMISYADMAQDNNADTIGEIWSNLISNKTTFIPDLAMFLLCFGCCVFYSAFIGDIFSSLAKAINLPGLLTKRYVLLGLLSSYVLLPLCLQDDLSALQFSSKIGVFGILVTVFVHIYRLIDGSYSSNSPLLNDLSIKQIPTWPNPKYNLFSINTGILTLVNMLCVAFLAHYNAINYYKELENKSINKYKLTIALGYTVSILVFVTMMLVGYGLFGLISQPLLLNNFHNTKDIFATYARFGTGLAILFAYPLMFAGLKSALKSLLISNTSINPSNTLVYKSIQVAILSVITSIAFKCSEDDVSVVLGIVGSVLGCGGAYILPGYLQLINMRKKKLNGLKNNQIDVIANHLLVALGFIFGGLGVWVTIKDSHSHSHH